MHLDRVEVGSPSECLPLRAAREIVGHMTYFARQGVHDAPSRVTAVDRKAEGADDRC